MLHILLPVPRSGSIFSVHMQQSSCPFLHTESSENFPCYNGHHPCILISHLLLFQGVRELLTSLPASELDDIHLSDHSIPARLHILQVLPRFPDQIHDIRFHHKFFQVLLRCHECFLSFQSGNLSDPGK